MKVLIVILLAAFVAAEQKREADPSYGHQSYGHVARSHVGYGHHLSYRVPVPSYGHSSHNIHKREADPQPEAEAEADPWGTTTLVRPAYGAVSHIGYSGLGYSSLGYGGLGYSSLGYGGLGHSSLGYGSRAHTGYGLGSYANHAYPALTTYDHRLHKREADPEAEADPWGTTTYARPAYGAVSHIGHSGLGYSSLGYSGLGYNSLGYSSLGHSSLGYGSRAHTGYGLGSYANHAYPALTTYGHRLHKREADPEAEPSTGYGHSLGYGHTIGRGYGYGRVGYGLSHVHRPTYGVARTYVAPRTYGGYGATHGW